MSNTQPQKHYVEIVPAALLSQRNTWPEVAQSLPCGAYFWPSPQRTFLEEATPEAVVYLRQASCIICRFALKLPGTKVNWREEKCY